MSSSPAPATPTSPTPSAAALSRSAATSPTPSTSSAAPLPTPSSTPGSAPTRRNALRNFYNITTAASPLNTQAPATFSPSAHLSQPLATSAPASLLTLENNLITEIRALDSDRKSLVYDNYKKLIDATETISKIRGGVAGGGAVGVLVERVEEALGGVGGGGVVDWVVGSEGRVRRLVAEGREAEARRVLERVREICGVWGEEGWVKVVEEALEGAIREREGWGGEDWKGEGGEREGMVECSVEVRVNGEEKQAEKKEQDVEKEEDVEKEQETVS